MRYYRNGKCKKQLLAWELRTYKLRRKVLKNGAFTSKKGALLLALVPQDSQESLRSWDSDSWGGTQLASVSNLERFSEAGPGNIKGK